MNNLKIINDRYGHDEGDFSIKLISDLLTETAGSTGLVGRVGGDEFALVMPALPSGEAPRARKRLSSGFISGLDSTMKAVRKSIILQCLWAPAWWRQTMR